MRRFLLSVIAVLAVGVWVPPPSASAQQALVIKPLAERKLSELPAGTLFWRIENFPSLAKAQAAAGSFGLAAEAAGKAWLFTLGPAGGSSEGGTKVVEVGPIPRVVAAHYLLRMAPPVAPRPYTLIRVPRRTTFWPASRPSARPVA